MSSGISRVASATGAVQGCNGISQVAGLEGPKGSRIVTGDAQAVRRRHISGEDQEIRSVVRLEDGSQGRLKIHRQAWPMMFDPKSYEAP